MKITNNLENNTLKNKIEDGDSLAVLQDNKNNITVEITKDSTNTSIESIEDYVDDAMVEVFDDAVSEVDTTDNVVIQNNMNSATNQTKKTHFEDKLFNSIDTFINKSKNWLIRYFSKYSIKIKRQLKTEKYKILINASIPLFIGIFLILSFAKHNVGFWTLLIWSFLAVIVYCYFSAHQIQAERNRNATFKRGVSELLINLANDTNDFEKTTIDENRLKNATQKLCQHAQRTLTELSGIHADLIEVSFISYDIVNEEEYVSMIANSNRYKPEEYTMTEKLGEYEENEYFYKQMIRNKDSKIYTLADEYEISQQFGKESEYSQYLGFLVKSEKATTPRQIIGVLQVFIKQSEYKLAKNEKELKIIATDYLAHCGELIAFYYEKL